MNKFELGDRVVKLDRALQKHNAEDDNTRRGVVDAISRKEGKVLVQWDSHWVNPKPEEMDVSLLVSEKEAEAKLSQLETEYNAWATAVKEKVQAAAALIEEAGDIAEAHGYSLGETYDLNTGIQSAMGHAGWNTSSWGC